MTKMQKLFKTILLAGLFLTVMLLPLWVETAAPNGNQPPYLPTDTAESTTAYHMAAGAKLDGTTYGDESFVDNKHFTPFLILSSAKAEDASDYLTIQLNWAGDEDRTSFRWDNVDAYVMEKGQTSSRYQLKRTADWTLQTSLPLKDSDGNDCEYALDYIATSLWPVYTVTGSSLENGVLTITLTYQPKADMDILLKWSDDDDVNGLRPETLANENINLQFSSGDWKQTPESMEKNEDGSWTAHFKNVPTYYYNSKGQLMRATPYYYDYRVQVVGLHPTYSTNILNASYTRAEGAIERSCALSATISLQAVCVSATYNMESYVFADGYSDRNWLPAWTRAEELGITLPDTVSMTLLSDGKPIDRADATVTFTREKGSAYPKMTKSWYLPQYDENGNQIDYGKLSVAYTPNLENGELDKQFVQSVTERTSGKNTTVTISTQIPGVKWIQVNSVWNDDNNSSGARPATLLATLLGNGVPVGKDITLSIDEKGTISGFTSDWHNLAQLDADGNYIHYTIEMVNLPAYYTMEEAETPAYSTEKGYSESASAVSLINRITKNLTFNMKTQTAKATVYWEGDGIGSEMEAKFRPKAVNLKVEYTTDGGATWQPYWGTDVFAVTPGSNIHEWNYEWGGLPAVDAAGNPVTYRVAPMDTSSMYTTLVDEPQYTKNADGSIAHSDFAIHYSYNDNWNYTIDLKWNEEKPAEKYHIEKVVLDNNELKAQYQLAISVQKNYNPGDLQVRIPYELFDNRNGAPIGTVSSIWIGPESAPTPDKSFTYRIDDKGTPDTSDDEVVFYNYKSLHASENFELPVEFTFLPINVIDCSVGSLTAKATGKYDGQTEEEYQQSGPITYRLDTGVYLRQHNKTVVGPKYYWDSSYGAQPDDYDPAKYNYVEYKVQASWTRNQPSTLYFVEKPGNGGEVCRVRKLSTNVPFTTNPDTMEATWSVSSTGAGNSDAEYYVLVRYPRMAHEDPLNPGQTTYETDYQNNIEFQLIADDKHPGDKGENDKNDIDIESSSTTMHWVDYKFIYDGELVSASKSLYSFSSGALTAMKYGGYGEANCSISMTVNGYNIQNGYSMDMTDDAVYLCATIDGKTTDYLRLTEEDYELSGKPYVIIGVVSVDRATGQRKDGHIPTDPFILWGRKGNTGEWEEITRFVMSSANENLSLDDITGKGYTALRITTPNDLQDETQITQRFNVRIKGSSPKVSQWIKQNGLTMMTAQNVAAYKVYAKDNQGEMYWANPYEKPNNSFASKWGLADEDKAQLGAYPYRLNAYGSFYPAQENAYMGKVADRPLQYDATHEMISARFSIYEYESINSTLLPEEVYNAKCQNGAVLYDLLPEGFVYDSAKGVRVYGTNTTTQGYGDGSGGTRYEFNYGDGTAALVSVRTIDDYRGTGRQMVIFTVKSLLADGKNYRSNFSTWYTGFGVQFYVCASYNDVTSGVKLYNITAAQRDDGKAISGGYTERGYGSRSDESIFILDANGQRALYDVNNDGIVSEETNTLYGYTDITPSMLQAMQNGLSKTVKGNSGRYQQNDVTALNGQYSYKLRMIAQKNGETSNVVIYDILERAANTGGASGETAGWKGSFIGVNTRQLQALGVAPVVLYSTETLTYNDPDTLLIEKNPGAWSTTPPEDLSTVTAVAFDLRKAADGSDFVFAENVAAEMEIIMKAPSSLQPSEYAYNRPAYNCTFRSAIAHEGHTSFNISGRTTLKLRDLQAFTFIKQFVKDDDTIGPLANVQFSLYQCTNTEEGHRHGTPGTSSACWGEAIRMTSSMVDGTVHFDKLDTGAYAIVETAVRKGFDLLRNTYWVFTVDASKGTVSAPVAMGSVTSDNVQMKWREGTDGQAGVWTLMNQRSSIEIEILKTWKDDNQQLIRPKTLIFDLYRNGILYRTKEVEAKTGSLGVVFENIPIYDEQGNNFTYKVVERIPEGYTEANNGEANVSTSYTKRQRVSFTNTRLGVLDIKKVVEKSHTTQPFGFTITLTDGNGNPLKLQDKDGNPVPITARRFTTDPETYTSETLTLDEAGKVRATIANGETLRLLDLPEGTKWQVSEDQNDYVSTVTPDPAAGTAGQDVNPGVVFTNIPQPANLSLNVTKAIEGKLAADKTKSFTFTLEAITENAPLPDITTATISGSGTTAFPSITFPEEGTFEYRISEKAGSDAGYTYDTAIYTVTVVVTDKAGHLTAEWTAKKGDADANTLLFTNRYHAEGSLTLEASKTVNGAVPTASQVFQFELTSGADTPAVKQTKQNVLGKVVFDQISYTQADVGKTYTYTVKETSQNGSGFTVDTTVYTVTVTIADNGDGTLTVSPTYHNGTQTVQAMAFDNLYRATGSLTLTAYKTVNDQTPTEDQVFSFQLKNGANTPAVSQTKQNAGGTVTFDPLNYTLDDVGKTYTYTLEETSKDGNGFITDKSLYTIEVRVDDNGDGTLTPRVTMYNGEIYVTRLEFNNHYYAEGSLTLTADKTVNGKTPTEDQHYTFSLESGDGTPVVQQTKENELGLVTFDDITYTLEDAGKTYTYTVKETTQDGNGLTTDKTVYTVTVSIEDNKDGTLTITPVYSNGTENVTAMSFHNTLVGSIELSKRVEGGIAPTDEEFLFTLAFTDESGTPLTDSFAYSGSKTGIIISGGTLTLKDGETLTISGVPVGTSCTVTEKGSVRYTTTINGTAGSSIRLPVKAETTPVVFVNTVVTTNFTVTKEWQGGNEGAISLTLYANGVKMDPQPSYTRNGDTYSYSGLPKYDMQGQTIRYAAKEHYVDGYMTIYQNVAPYESESSFIYDGGTIINRAVTDIAVRKVWTGMDEKEERPEITLTLYCNGQVVNKKPKLDKNGWYHFYNLPIRDEPYYVVETPVNGYATSYENVGSYASVTDRAYHGGTIINHKIPKTGDNTHSEIYLALLLISISGLVLCRKAAKRNHDS